MYEKGKGREGEGPDRWTLQLGLDQCLFELESMRKGDKQK